MGAIALVSAAAYFWPRLDRGNEAARSEQKSLSVPMPLVPSSSAPISIDVARVFNLREPEATKARQLLRDEQEAIQQMMLAQHRSFIGPSDVEPIRSDGTVKRVCRRKRL
jgi:hypothetical protein